MQPVARIAMLSLGGLLMVAGLAVPPPVGPVWQVVGAGVAFCLLVLIERRYRKPMADTPPGPGWEGTPEKFIDDETGQVMQVWYHPASGRRAYLPAR